LKKHYLQAAVGSKKNKGVGGKNWVEEGTIQTGHMRKKSGGKIRGFLEGLGLEKNRKASIIRKEANRNPKRDASRLWLRRT